MIRAHLTGVGIALANLRSHKLRTFLTLLGNIVGTMSVIAVVSLIYGADQYARRKVLDEGTDVFTIVRVNPVNFLTDFDAFLESLNNPELTLEDRDWLADRLTLARAVGASVETAADLRAGTATYRGCQVRGKTEEYPLLEDLPLARGRHLTPADLRTSAEVAVLGWDVARDLFPRSLDPVGKEFRLQGRHFTVVGVVADKGTVLGSNQNTFAIVPITSWQKVFGARESIDIKVAVAELERFEEAKDEAAFQMRVRHRLRPVVDDDFGIMTADQLLQIWKGIAGAIYAAMTPLVGISLVIGGIVLMNVMLVSVTERTREVGVRKALGATRRNIAGQFLVEAVTLSLTGGMVGILIGGGITWLICAISDLNFAIPLWSVGLGLGSTFLIGAFFGAWPAWKAAGLDPVEALRHE
ncbi:MAG TPA: ABC transporter permease [Candidatus Krumholzibacteria bacterium]|nr:ABC transporter permease [Candidatus Krumholzibacteria bacterium]HPD70908.1 ABC transporter permease [Candidatus Krumholzibacteria bacterium]HRY39392.1 ABC transporter permease [Candidatus Krumholzibacteria bacterium]